jgi:hypothetical protein
MQQIHHASTAASPQSVAAAPSAAAQSGAPAAVASSAVMVASTGAEHSAPQAAESAAAPVALVASSALQSVSRRGRKGRKLSGSTRVEFASANAAQRVTAEAAAQPMLASAPSPSAQAPAGASALMHLASSGAGGPAMVAGAPPAGSTWPGYSNLMYCDPVVCSGPMPVVHIKVPVGQGAPNAQPGSSSGFVNADVVIGPDGVARAIRVAN